jgi:hypothetical protein
MNPNDKFSPPPSAAQAPTLASALHAAAAELQQTPPPPELRSRVLAAAQAALATRSAVRPVAASGWWQRPWHAPAHAAGAAPQLAPRKGWWAWSGAAACAAVLAGSAFLMLRVPAPGAGDESVRFGGVDSGFLPLVPPERWPREAAPAWLVSTEMTGERLAALGLPYDPGHAGDSVRAELLLHPSGEVLAVRFLH